MLIRRERAADGDAIADVHRSAFATGDGTEPAEVGLVAALRSDPSWIPELALVAVVDDRIVGHVCVTAAVVGGSEHRSEARASDGRPQSDPVVVGGSEHRSEARARSGASDGPPQFDPAVVGGSEHRSEARVGGLAPIGVRGEVQGDGVGSALMHAVLAAADALGLPLVGLVGHLGYYPRFGFVPAAELGIVPSEPDWASHFQIRTLAGYEPGTTGEFRYAAPFYTG